MKRAIPLLIILLTATAGAVLAGDADEGEPHKKCGVEAAACVREMAESFKKRGWIGIEWNDAEDRPRITNVVEGSPAAAAGVRIDDVVLRFDGISTDLDDEQIWAGLKRSLVPGKVLTLSIERDGDRLDLPVELVALPDPIIAQWIGQHMLQHHVAPPDVAAAQSP